MLHVGDPPQQPAAQPLDLRHQHARVGERLRSRQLSRRLRQDRVDSGHQRGHGVGQRPLTSVTLGRPLGERGARGREGRPEDVLITARLIEHAFDGAMGYAGRQPL